MRIVLVSHQADLGTFRVGSHHLARELARAGHDVMHLSTPYSAVHAVLRRDPHRGGLAARGPFTGPDGVVHVVPRTVLPATAGLTHRAVGRSVADAGFADPDVWLVDQPLMHDVHRLPRGGALVYRPTDLYPTGRTARGQRVLMRHADAVVATSGPVLAALHRRPSMPATVLENGVEFDRFAAAAAPVRQGMVYVGALDERFDWEALAAIARAAPDQSVDVYGPAPAKLRPLPPNVTVRGAVPYAQVPEILGRARVGLLPLSDAPSNRGRSPMKLYEYIAAGLPVLARRTPVLAAREDEGTVLTYATHADVAAATAAALARSPLPAPVRDLARREDWAVKAATLVTFLERVTGRS